MLLFTAPNNGLHLSPFVLGTLFCRTYSIHLIKQPRSSTGSQLHFSITNTLHGVANGIAQSAIATMADTGNSQVMNTFVSPTFRLASAPLEKNVIPGLGALFQRGCVRWWSPSFVVPTGTRLLSFSPQSCAFLCLILFCFAAIVGPASVKKLQALGYTQAIQVRFLRCLSPNTMA